MFLKQVKGEIP